MASSFVANSTSQAFAQSGTTHAQQTVSSTAIDLLDGITLNEQTTHVLVQFNDATARVTFDGATDPTATVGFRYLAGSTAYWSKILAQQAKCIREASTDVVVEIQELNFR